MLGQRQRHWPTIDPALGHTLIWTGRPPHFFVLISLCKLLRAGGVIIVIIQLWSNTRAPWCREPQCARDDVYRTCFRFIWCKKRVLGLHIGY